MDRDGENIRCLTSDSQANETFPDWSPVSNDIVFSSNRNGVSALYLVKSDGSDLRLLCELDGHSYCPRWSPDGKRIAFASRFGNNPEICVINADGTELMRLTEKTDQDVCPSWSPDGRQIVYSSSNGISGEDISLMNSDGTNDRIIIRNYESNDFVPTFSPDGNYIAFQMSYGRDDEIAVYNVQTEEIVRLTYSRGWDSEPRWRK